MLFISWFLNLGFVFYDIFGENCVQKYEFDFVLNYSICFYTCSIFRKMLSNEVLMLRILMLYLKYTWFKMNNNFNILIFFPNEYNFAFKIFIFIDKLENRKFSSKLKTVSWSVTAIGEWNNFCVRIFWDDDTVIIYPWNFNDKNFSTKFFVVDGKGGWSQV